VFLVNSVVAVLLILSYGLSYVPPNTFSFLSVLSLTVPLLIILNIMFGIYWLLRIKKQFLLSVLVLVLGYNYVMSFYKFSTEIVSSKSSFSLMSYNVRLFNVYDWIDEPFIPEKIQNFLLEKSPSIVCFQEYDLETDLIFKSYPYSYFTEDSSKHSSKLAMFSKYQILSSGTIDFPKSSNNAIYADVIIKSDTIRIYNIHLQSSGINTNIETLDSKQSNKLISRLGATFKDQQYQAELVVSHMFKSPFKVILCGDFNNTIYSYVYRILKSEMYDAFDVAGSGFGRTYKFKYFPFRIDFILADSKIKVLNFSSFNELPYSDHFPIMSEFTIED
jgi:vancomycin resistance protein VanJ